nr:movement protein [Blackcurrant reversion virus]
MSESGNTTSMPGCGRMCALRSTWSKRAFLVACKDGALTSDGRCPQYGCGALVSITKGVQQPKKTASAKVVKCLCWVQPARWCEKHSKGPASPNGSVTTKRSNSARAAPAPLPYKKQTCDVVVTVGPLELVYPALVSEELPTPVAATPTKVEEVPIPELPLWLAPAWMVEQPYAATPEVLCLTQREEFALLKKRLTRKGKLLQRRATHARFEARAALARVRAATQRKVEEVTALVIKGRRILAAHQLLRELEEVAPLSQAQEQLVASSCAAAAARQEECASFLRRAKAWRKSISATPPVAFATAVASKVVSATMPWAHLGLSLGGLLAVPTLDGTLGAKQWNAKTIATWVLKPVVSCVQSVHAKVRDWLHSQPEVGVTNTKVPLVLPEVCLGVLSPPSLSEEIVDNPQETSQSGIWHPEMGVRNIYVFHDDSWETSPEEDENYTYTFSRQCGIPYLLVEGRGAEERKNTILGWDFSLHNDGEFEFLPSPEEGYTKELVTPVALEEEDKYSTASSCGFFSLDDVSSAITIQCPGLLSADADVHFFDGPGYRCSSRPRDFRPPVVRGCDYESRVKASIQRKIENPLQERFITVLREKRKKNKKKEFHSFSACFAFKRKQIQWPPTPNEMVNEWEEYCIAQAWLPFEVVVTDEIEDVTPLYPGGRDYNCNSQLLFPLAPLSTVYCDDSCFHPNDGWTTDGNGKHFRLSPQFVLPDVPIPIVHRVTRQLPQFLYDLGIGDLTCNSGYQAENLQEEIQERMEDRSEEKPVPSLDTLISKLSKRSTKVKGAGENRYADRHSLTEKAIFHQPGALSRMRSGKEKTIVAANHNSDQISVRMAECGKPVFTPLPRMSDEMLRKFLEKGLGSTSTVALDIGIQSHIPQGMPTVAFVNVMDTRIEDPLYSSLCGSYIDLGRDRAKTLCLPLVNFPMSKLAEDVDDVLNGLMLCTHFQDSTKFGVGKPAFQYGTLEFQEFKPSAYSDFSRVRDNWDAIAKQQNTPNDRILAGFSVLGAVSQAYNQALPVFKSVELVAPPKRKPVVATFQNPTTLGRSNTTRSFRMPTMDLPRSTGRDAPIPIVHRRNNNDVHGFDEATPARFSTCD